MCAWAVITSCEQVNNHTATWNLQPIELFVTNNDKSRKLIDLKFKGNRRNNIKKKIEASNSVLFAK